MNTYRTLDEARVAAAERTDVAAIIDIEHAANGRCYICARAPMGALAMALRDQPMPEIAQLIAEHKPKTEAEYAVIRERHLREKCRCERCGDKLDGNIAYSQEERSSWGGRPIKVTAYYCESCRQLLQVIGGGEYSAMEERAGAVDPAEPYTKSDH